ncbi:hypothetical protein DVH24_036683 [Malus domestica]|uniref:Uncharacterized protein n=1 Tax=Malus domestica TaxID=3750 RepID=A0A498IK42_MALDO|nr:hypothetical protein DVH24_036683 [Malus domestica]
MLAQLRKHLKWFPIVVSSVCPPAGSEVNLKAFQQHIMNVSNLITQLNSLHVCQFILVVFQLCEAQSCSDREKARLRVVWLARNSKSNGICYIHDIVCFGPRPRPHGFVSGNSDKNFPVGHLSWDCSRANSLNFGVPMKPETGELPKGLVLGRDENIHIRLIGSTPRTIWDLTYESLSFQDSNAQISLSLKNFELPDS